MSKRYNYYCSCSQGKLKYECTNTHTTMIRTVATGDGLCVHCDHQAVACMTTPSYLGNQYPRDKSVPYKEIVIGGRI